MNYRHAYHAGNFADVLKHVVLTLVIEHLKLKPQPFRVIDTHAGIGLYDLAGVEAGKTGEWRGGIARLLDADLAPTVREVLAPYLDCVRQFMPRIAGEHAPLQYPGSPMIARALMRADDVLVVNELHPDDRATLSELFRRDGSTKVLGLDGYTVLKSTLPPKERRGVVLVDPPFETAGEFDRMSAAIAEAHRRFAGGTQMLWYPIKDVGAVSRFHRDIRNWARAETFVVELAVRAYDKGEAGLAATGLVVVNPPYTLDQKLTLVLPELAHILCEGQGGNYRLEWLVDEQSTILRRSAAKT